MTVVYRSLKEITPPAAEPVSLAEAKQHLRVDIDADDTYISSLIKAAREFCEGYLDMTLIAKQYRMKLDFFPAEVRLPKPPMMATGTHTAVSVAYTTDAGGNTTTLSLSQFRIDRDSVPGRMYPLYGGSWPGHIVDDGSVTIDWWAGYGTSAASVPQKVRHAILMIVHHWYESRSAVEQGSMAEVPMGAKALLDMSKWGSYT